MDQPILMMTSAALLALVGVLSVITTARAFFGRMAPLGYLLILAVIGSLLSLRAWILPYPIEGGVAIVLLLLAVFSWRKWADLNLREVIAPLNLAVLAALLLELLWAAAPIYRYDQWNYHLVVSKHIQSFGSLPLPILDDHVYFTGFYEYLFLLPRLICRDDVFVQSFASSFTWLSVFYLIYAAIGAIDAGSKRSAVGTLALAYFVIASLPYQQSLMSAKPEVILVACAVWGVLLGYRLEDKASRFWFGWLLLFPIIIKVTWLHVGFAMGAVFLFRPLVERKFELLWGVCKGVLLAGLLVIPIFAKNVYFFGNPIHPIQLGPLRSTFWSNDMATYWQGVTHAAHTVPRYFEILFLSIPAAVIDLSYQLLYPLVIVMVYLVYHHQRIMPKVWPVVKSYGLIGAALIIYLLTMPFVLDPQQMPRFALPMIGLVLPLIIAVWDESGFSTRTQVAWLILFGVLAGGPDSRWRKVAPIIRAGSINRAYEEAGNPYIFKTVADIVGEHRRRTYPDAKLNQKIIAANSPTKYFFDSTMLYLGETTDLFIRNNLFAKEFPSHNGFCMPEYLRFLDVSYIYLGNHECPYHDLTDVNLMAVKYGQRLSSKYSITYLSSEALQRAANDAEICPRKFATRSDLPTF